MLTLTYRDSTRIFTKGFVKPTNRRSLLVFMSVLLCKLQSWQASAVLYGVLSIGIKAQGLQASVPSHLAMAANEPVKPFRAFSHFTMRSTFENWNSSHSPLVLFNVRLP